MPSTFRFRLLLSLLAALTGGCGRSLEDEMRAKAAAMATAPADEEKPATKTAPVPAKESPDPPTTVPPVPSRPVAMAPSKLVASRQPQMATPDPASQPSSPVALLPQRPSEPLSPEAARTKSLQNLERIATALLTYVEDKKRLPDAAIVATRGEQEVALLSWRVTLLPYLGYESLYRQFRLNEPWNSAHNKKLIAQIPPEYQSPNRFDTTTNYLIPVGNQTAFSRGRGRVPAHFTGGAENVAMLLEADDSHAATWTAPQDLSYEAATPRTGLGSLRTDGLFVALASGVVGRVPADTSDTHLRELFSIDEDSIPAGMHVKRVAPEAPLALAASDAEPLVIDPPSTSTPGAAAAANSREPRAPAVHLPEFYPPKLPRPPIPEEAQLQTARALLRDVYRGDYEGATTIPARRALAASMLEDARSLTTKPAECYELLRITHGLMVSLGMLEESLAAVRLLEEQFEVDGLALRVKTLGELVKSVRTPAEAKRLTEQAALLLRQSLEQDDYSAAEGAREIYTAAMRMSGDRTSVARAAELSSVIAALADAHANVPQAIDVLKVSPNDSQACALVGKYYCLVKQRWEEFLPLLAQGDDVRLRVVATIDLEGNHDAEAVLQLADQYWELAEYYRMPYNAGLRRRAVHHYRLAINQHSGGLAKIRAQKRLEQWRDTPSWTALFQPIDMPAAPGEAGGSGAAQAAR